MLYYVVHHHGRTGRKKQGSTVRLGLSILLSYILFNLSTLFVFQTKVIFKFDFVITPINIIPTYFIIFFIDMAEISLGIQIHLKILKFPNSNNFENSKISKIFKNSNITQYMHDVPIYSL